MPNPLEALQHASGIGDPNAQVKRKIETMPTLQGSLPMPSGGILEGLRGLLGQGTKAAAPEGAQAGLNAFGGAEPTIGFLPHFTDEAIQHAIKAGLNKAGNYLKLP